MPATSVSQAIAAINAGRFDSARSVLEKHLTTAPGDFEARYLLGVTHQASNRPEIALTHYDSVLTRMPDHLAARYNMAILLSTLGRHEDAMRHHDAAVRLAPANPWVYVNRGASLAALRRCTAALSDFDRAINTAPDLAAGWANKGSLLLDMGQFAQALSCLDRSLQLDPSNANNWVNRSSAQVKLRHPEPALQDAEQCLSIDPGHAGGWTCKAIALRLLGKPAEALACVDHALERQPSAVNSWLTRGDILTDLDRYEEGFACYDRCIQLQPGHEPSLINKAVVLADLGRSDDARRCFEQVAQLNPQNPDATWNLALLDIRDGNLRDGWLRFEARWKKSDADNRPLVTQRPIWTGTPSDRPLLLWGEQGIGDQILYGSILPELASIPQKKLVALDRRLLTLFGRSMPGFEFVDLAKTSDSLDFADQLPLGSLPRYFRPSEEAFNRALTPFLRADPDRTSALKAKLRRPDKLICGVSWASNRKSIGAQKSVQLDQLVPPLSSEHLQFVDLQYGDTTNERNCLLSSHGIDVEHLDEIDNFQDIDGLAALISACDIIITVSNTTAHLAGALGKPTMLLLPLGKGRLWYWNTQEKGSLWYPSIRTFCQQRPGDWSEPIAAMKTHITTESWKR